MTNAQMIFWAVFWGQRAAFGDSLDSILELILWVLALIAFLIIGTSVILRIRREATEGTGSASDEDIMEQFDRYLEKKLITYDEYEMIRKNLRDQMVYDVYMMEKQEKENKKRKKNRKEKISEQDKEERLKTLLKGLHERR